jgi:Competence protein CoiA-like family
MKLSGSRLQFGIRDGALKHISEVTGGLDCDCRCASCDDRLVAKKGAIKQHHFAHACGSECATALETALHFAAKQILESRREIYLPAAILNFNRPNSVHKLTNEQLVGLKNVRLERKLGQIIPDVIASANGQLLSIEIRVTHPVDSLKLKRISELGLSTLEIDLSKAARNLTELDLETLVIGPGAHKKWLYNAGVEAKRSEMLSAARILAVSEGNFYSQVYGCPLWKKSTKRGEPYADLDEDCSECQHALEVSSKYVLCSAIDLAYQKRLF